MSASEALARRAVAARYWYASNADADRDARGVEPVGAYAIAYAGGDLWLYRSMRDVGALGAAAYRIDVTGRSAAHVDRLARDWIAHGVAPTKTGGRGYCYRWWLDDSRSPMAALAMHERAERRARRVVRR